MYVTLIKQYVDLGGMFLPQHHKNLMQQGFTYKKQQNNSTTVEPHLLEHLGTGGCSSNRNAWVIWISGCLDNIIFNA